jgi:hypothetical protein
MKKWNKYSKLKKLNIEVGIVYGILVIAFLLVFIALKLFQ